MSHLLCSNWMSHLLCSNWMSHLLCSNWMSHLLSSNWMSHLQCSNWISHLLCSNWMSHLLCSNWMSHLLCGNWMSHLLWPMVVLFTVDPLAAENLVVPFTVIKKNNNRKCWIHLEPLIASCAFPFQPLFVNEIIVYSLRFAFCQLFTTGCLYCEKGCIFFQLAAMTTAALDRNARLVSRYQMPFSFMEVKPVPGCHMDRADVMFPWEKTEGMS